MNIKVSTFLKDAILQQEPYMDKPIDLSLGDDAELYSETGQLDSLSLITIIADIEKLLLKQLGLKIPLATEQDLSFQNSPFKTFGSMVLFINKRIHSVQQESLV